ncbi:fimbrillin family protein [Bacteroides gallinarum]|uniref:fimbrillin family protein n=2 Tax=Bacteroides gallinarum TaxID=376806 RepID=UPI000372C101|nr:fimbrillin family protein [Bacteroides gallinarum]
MRFYKYLLFTGFLTLIMTGNSCSQEEEVSVISNRNMIINVNDVGMADCDENAISRVETDLDYNTIFEDGDCIGLFAVKDGKIVEGIDNLEVSYSEEAATWVASSLRYEDDMENMIFYAYYPYAAGMSIDVDAADVFSDMVSNWTLSSDQSTKKRFAAADLMTSGAAVIQHEASGQYTLQLGLKHRMALSVMIAPETEYIFTEPALNVTPYIVKNGGDVIFYTSSVGDENEVQPYKAGDGTYRMIVKPAEEKKMIGVQGEKQYEFTTSISEGKYKRFLLEGGKKIKSHDLQVGDFYCADGTIVSGKEDVPDNCIGIVYYVGNVHPSVLYREDSELAVTPEKDVLLEKYPGCVHGLVCALKSSNANAVSRFCASSKYDYVKKASELGITERYIWTTMGKTSIPEYILGFNNTVILREFTKETANCADDMFDNMDLYANQNPVPAFTTGWYLPSIEEFRILFTNQSTLNDSLEKGNFEKLWSNPAGYDSSAEKYFGYWSSTVRADRRMSGARIDGGEFTPYAEKDPKTGQGYFRFAFAF